MSSTCDVLFILASYKVFIHIGIKRSFVLGFCIGLSGSIFLILFGNNIDYIPFMVILAKVGMSFLFNVVYLSFALLFSPLYS